MSAFPKAILHIDGDAFFAACEQARNPALKGKPVITGKERGIAASMSYEAKAQGITRGMRLFEIKKICPDAVILSSDFRYYEILSQRFMTIIRRFTPEVEEYGIDECFADITGQHVPLKISYEQLALTVQEALARELGCTFSIGLGPNKVLAKMGSKWKKPHGFTVVTAESADSFLSQLQFKDIWGIGRRSAKTFYNKGIFTPLELKYKQEVWACHSLAKPLYELWRELHGYFAMPLITKAREEHFSIQTIRTFTPPSANKVFLKQELSRNIERACRRARHQSVAAKEVAVFLRTQEFHDEWKSVSLPCYSSFPHEIIPACLALFEKMYRSSNQYRATGVMLTHFEQHAFAQHDLFGVHHNQEKMKTLYQGVDAIHAKYGSESIMLGSSLHRETGKKRKTTRERMINIPFLTGVLK